MVSLAGTICKESSFAAVSILAKESITCARHRKKEKEISIRKMLFTNAAKLLVEMGVPKNSLQNQNEFWIGADLIERHCVCQWPKQG